MITFLIVIIGLSFLILSHEAGHFLVAKIFGLKIDEFGFGFPPRIFAKKKGETEYSVNFLPFGGFVKIAGEDDEQDSKESSLPLPNEGKSRLFFAQKPWKRAMIVIAGVGANFVIGWLLLSFIFMVGTPSVVMVSGVEKNSPAAEVGLRGGDIVRSYKAADAEDFQSEIMRADKSLADQFREFVNRHRGQVLELEIMREGKTVKVTVTPRLHTEPDQGALGVLLGDVGIPRHSFFRAIGEGFRATVMTAWFTLVAFADLFRNLFFRGELLAGVVGPVGIFAFAHQSGEIGFAYVIQLLAIISINLSVINLIPFPALDGGRLFMIGIEKTRGSPLSRKTESFINTLGFIFLIFLMVLITIRDIINL